MTNGETGGWIDLTWADLQDWAGRESVVRGKNYQREGRVRTLHRRSPTELEATVRGTVSYDVRVTRTGPELDSECTCPVGARCKHAVATILEYLLRLERNITVPDAPPIDSAAQNLLNSNPPPVPVRTAAEESGESDDTAGAKGLPANYIEGLKGQEIRQLLMELADRHPSVRQELQERAQLATDEAQPLIQKTLREIRRQTSEPAWIDSWSGRGYQPDFSAVQRRLELLLERRQADALLPLGQELLKRGIAQAESSQDDGETADAIARCLNVIFRALAESSLPPEKKILWALEAERADQYEMCGGARLILNAEYPAETWSRVADELAVRLDASPVVEPSDRDYALLRHRDYLVEHLIEVLEKAGRHCEIIPLCEREAPRTMAYERLVTRLLKAGKRREALAWIRQGWDATVNSYPGIALNLRGMLAKIWLKLKDYGGVASLAAEDYWNHPSVSTFQSFRNAAQAAGVWEQCEGPAREYMRTGRVPNGADWPLRPSGFVPPRSPEWRRFPLCEEILRLALDENDIPAVLSAYEEYRSVRSSPFGHLPEIEDAVAQAVQEHAPETSVAIWKRLAELTIRQANAKAYSEAAVFLRRLGDFLQARQRETEWREYLQKLRAEHARKKRFLETLDHLERVRIIRPR